MKRAWQTQAVSQMGAGEGGMLLYLNDKGFEASHVKPTVPELKSIIILRNAVAVGIGLSEAPRLHNRKKKDAESSTAEGGGAAPQGEPAGANAGPTVLPKMSVSLHQCEGCFSSEACTLYRRTELEMEGVGAGGGGVYAELITEKTKHLTPTHLRYFQEWDRMLDMELSQSNVNIVKSWLVPAAEREISTGRSIASLVWKNYRYDLEANGDKPVVLLFERGYLFSSAASPVGSPGESQQANEPPPTPQSQRLKRFSLSNLSIDVGNRVVVSTDHHITSEQQQSQQQSNSAAARTTTMRHQLHLLKGDVVKVAEGSISVKVSKAEYMKLSNVHADWGGDKEEGGTGLRFRLDVDEFATSGGALRQNLVNLCNNTPLGGQMRAMIIDGLVPRYNKVDKDRMFVGAVPGRLKDEKGVHGCDMENLRQDYAALNSDQQAAVDKIVHARDYTIVQGLPGTGKTSTVAYVVRLLVARGLRVLVTSYTHAAVDNLLMKLKDLGVGCGGTAGHGDMLRIGSDYQVRKECQDLIPKNVAADKYGYADDDSEKPNEIVVNGDALMRVMQEAKIVGVSCLTAPKTPLLAEGTGATEQKKLEEEGGPDFDVVIVDEAGQITVPAILGSLGKAKTFVLVGDHLQLPPLVKDDTAIEAGYSVSLLKSLAEKVPESIAQLTLQYRMHEDIVLLVNVVAYKGALKCGNLQVQKGLIVYGGGEEGWKEHQLVKFGGTLAGIRGFKPDWLLNALLETNVATFLNTDSLGVDLEVYIARGGAKQEGGGARKSGNGNVVNPTEIDIVKELVRGLSEACSFDLKEVGIISHYRSQVKALRGNDYLLECIEDKKLEIATIDTYQGRDKKVIIFSLVHSNQIGSGGQLLKDLRRINVALSRAKVKLILVGSKSTLSKGSECMKEVLESMAEKNWIQELKELEETGESSSHGGVDGLQRMDLEEEVNK